MPSSSKTWCSGNHYVSKALCDPGASTNLMPKSIFQKLGIGEAKPTTVMLQLADRSYVQPEGKIEDILVQVDKFIFPADFLILDCEADEHAPIILGRPFLATGRVLIDFENGELILRVNDQQEEQGFLYEDGLDNYGLEQIIHKRLTDLGWLRFGRNKLVPGDAATINDLLDLPNNEESIYNLIAALKDEDYDMIKDQLCTQGTAWNRGGKNLGTINRRNLRPEAKLWNTFIKRNLMLTSHNQTVDKPRYLLKQSSNLAFPCLISALYRRAAVPTRPKDLYTPRRTGWACSDYMKKMDLTDALPIRMAMPTPAASSAAILESAPAVPEHYSPPTQTSKAPSAYILQLRKQLQRIEVRQLTFIAETKVVQNSLVQFFTSQFPAAATFFPDHQAANPPVDYSTAKPSAEARKTEMMHYSLNATSDAIDWNTPFEHRPSLSAQPTAADILGSSYARK
ncbi:hypothetical protein V6N13_025551 [Hibiscus sabdariffa]